MGSVVGWIEGFTEGSVEPSNGGSQDSRVCLWTVGGRRSVGLLSFGLFYWGILQKKYVAYYFFRFFGPKTKPKTKNCLNLKLKPKKT